MIKFEVIGKDKEDLKSKIAANFKEDEEALPSWKEITKGINALIDALSEPRVGNVVSARIKIDLAEGMVHIHMDSFPSNVMGSPSYYG